MLGILSSSLCFFLLLFSVSSSPAPEDDMVLLTNSGPIKGKLLSIGSGSVIAYLGIPYAKPPLGKLRFQKPLPCKPWSHVLEATSFGNSCPQVIFGDIPDVKMWAPQTPLSEDCLFLNIWVPHPRPSSPAPILFWIHGGGGFLSGSSSVGLYNGAFFAATENVIVVSINYRLGVLGFLSMPPASPGNMGLWDQHLALSWIKDNAAAFGGDPNRVTIFGHNSGAVSVGMHLLSPKSQPLFARAVLQSGAPNTIWAWMNPEKAKQKTLAFSQQLGCVEGDANAVVSCLQEKDVAAFSQPELAMVLGSKFLLDLVFLPTTDGDFLPKEPEKLLQTGQLQVKPTLIGVTSEEASAFVPYLFPNVSDSLITWDQYLKAIRMTLRRASEDDIQAVALSYSEGNQGPARYRSAMTQALTDYFFICPIAEFAAEIQEAGSPVYVYFFSHHTSGSVFPEWIGAPHGAELPYVFGNFATVLVANQTYTEAEAALSHKIMQYWAEFSRSGSPTGLGTNELQWSLYNATLQSFFHLTTDSSQPVQISPTQKCGFLKAHSSKQDADGFILLKKNEDMSKNLGKKMTSCFNCV